MKKILGVIVALLVLTTIASASAVQCSTETTLAQLVALGSGGCYIGSPSGNGDTWFTGFTYAASDSSTAAQTTVNVTSVQITGLVDEAEFSFNNAYSNATYTIGFTASVCTAALVTAGDCVTASPVGNTFGIVQSELLILAGQQGSGTATWTSGATPNPQIQPLATNATQIESTYGNPGVTATSVSSVFGGSNQYETSDQLAVYQQNAPSGVPEPSTMLLMGGALVGLGVIGRKRNRKA